MSLPEKSACLAILGKDGLYRCVINNTSGKNKQEVYENCPLPNSYDICVTEFNENRPIVSKNPNRRDIRKKN